jgi:hypothetical protein
MVKATENGDFDLDFVFYIDNGRVLCSLVRWYEYRINYRTRSIWILLYFAVNPSVCKAAFKFCLIAVLVIRKFEIYIR